MSDELVLRQEFTPAAQKLIDAYQMQIAAGKYIADWPTFRIKEVQCSPFVNECIIVLDVPKEETNAENQR